MGPGDNIVAARQLYGGSINQFSQGFAKFDWHVRWAGFYRFGARSMLAADAEAISGLVRQLRNALVERRHR